MKQLRQFQDLMFNIDGLGKDMYEFPFTIMYFISSRSQVVFNPENLIVENKRINKFLFGKIEKYLIGSILGIIIDRIKQKRKNLALIS